MRRIILSLLIVLSMFAFGCSSSGDSNIPPYNDTGINDNIQGDTSINDNVQGDTGINDNVQGDTGINDNIQGVTSLLKVKSVIIDNSTVYAITEQGRLYTWGKNYYGQVGNGESGCSSSYDPSSCKEQTTPYEVKEVGRVKSVEIDNSTVYTITEDDRLYAWGQNEYAQVGNGKKGYDENGSYIVSPTPIQTTPYEVTSVGKVKSVVTDGSTVYAITEYNRLYAWGYNYYGQVGNGKSGILAEQPIPYEVTSVGTVKSVEVYGNSEGSTVYAITEDSRLYAWGYNYYGQVGIGYIEQTTPYEVTEVGTVKSVEVYGNSDGATVYAITEDNRLYTWGDNRFGQVGNGYTAERTRPYEVTEVGKVKSVVTDGATVYAITEDGRLYAWGDDNYGEVGNGTTTTQLTPYEVTSVGKVKSVEVNNSTVYVITEDNRLYTWGNNYNGEVGNGTTTAQTTPYEVTQVGKVKSVEVNNSTVYAITEDNRLYAWGDNEYGEVGNGTTIDVTTPYEVTEVGTVKSVEINLDTVYAITEDGRLYAWGDNISGQIGNGKIGRDTHQSIPYEVKEVGTVKSVEIYIYNDDIYNNHQSTVYAITEDGRLYAWGYNQYGLVGNGTTTNQLTPYEVKEIIKTN